jgi:serine/threonine protein phosphatase PrpC
MEDAHLATGSFIGGEGNWHDTALFGVFDGHGGAQVAQFCSNHLPDVLRHRAASDAPASLRDTFLHMDKMLAGEEDGATCTVPGQHDYVGSTAVVTLINKQNIVVANVGDSRAVVSNNGLAHDLSHDHKPTLSSERARIRNAGGFVKTKLTSCGTQKISRVNGKLAVSRAIGDLAYKNNLQLGAAEQAVTCVPDVKTYSRQHGDEFMIIACDGVWDVLSSQEAVKRVRRDLGAIKRGELQPCDVAHDILGECCASDPKQTYGTDNMTMILIVFDEHRTRTPNDCTSEKANDSVAANKPIHVEKPSRNDSGCFHKQYQPMPHVLSSRCISFPWSPASIPHLLKQGNPTKIFFTE